MSAMRVRREKVARQPRQSARATPTGAVCLSDVSQDAEAAQKICDASRVARPRAPLQARACDSRTGFRRQDPAQEVRFARIAYQVRILKASVVLDLQHPHLISGFDDQLERL
jgi:hypothetical protein